MLRTNTKVYYGDTVRKFFLITTLCISIASTAAEEEAPERYVDVPPPTVIIHSTDSDVEEFDGFEPEITIIRKKNATYQEYRHNGRLFMVKVVPMVGKAYFFVDRDGDGVMETRRDDRSSILKVPQWVIFSW